MVSDALDCAEKLVEEGYSVEVIDMYCVKPLDIDLVLSESKGKKAVVTFEIIRFMADLEVLLQKF